MVKAHATWESAHAEAVRVANRLNIDVGIERFGREWVIRLLPRIDRSFGYDLRCERIRPGELQ